jgi:thiamine-monophosphate kinase
MTRPFTEKDVLNKIGHTFPATGKGALGLPLNDDAALIAPADGCEAILTCDWFLEGSHFTRDKHPADAVGWKCLTRAASDIAAMGGMPRCFLLSLAIPESQTGTWLTEFLLGLRDAAEHLKCKLAGGDTTRHKKILINVTVVGEVVKGKAIRRSGATPGDQLFVTGKLGESELGLRLLRKPGGFSRARNPATQKHLYPEARLALGQWLSANQLATAMMDLSDGLSSDLPRLCAASGVGARLVAEQLPLTALVDREDALPLALHGGDDYELLFAVKPAVARKLPKTHLGLSLTLIGEITAAKKIVVETAGKTKPLIVGGWDPFRKR